MTVKGTLFVLSAPSGGGKTSLVNALVANDENLRISISHTTRAPRPGEQDGVNYFFTDESHFKALEAKGHFLESARVFNHYYGTSKAWVMEQLQSGLDVILEIDWQGMQKIKSLLPCTCIFILPPSQDVLLTRLRERKQDNEEVIQTRMAKAREEMSHYPEYDYVIINNRFDVALADLASIIRAERLRLPRQQARYASVFGALLP